MSKILEESGHQSFHVSSNTVDAMCYLFVMWGQQWSSLDNVCCQSLLVSFAQPGTLVHLHRPVSPHSSPSSPPWPSSLLQLKFPVKTHSVRKSTVSCSQDGFLKVLLLGFASLLKCRESVHFYILDFLRLFTLWTAFKTNL